MAAVVSGAFGFPKARRLRRRREFLAVQGGRSRLAADPAHRPGPRPGLRRRSGRFVFFLRPRPGGGPSRIGITTSAKVGNAVRRNRIRRLVREAWRTHARLFPAGHDVVVLVISGEGEWTLSRVLEELTGWNRPRPPTCASKPA
ncbi:MAG: ribonuclease P protein component [Deltaproteobacteria bacterium]|nr:ribonuclease P protein component [Deltaproteobacteria bacterium]